MATYTRARDYRYLSLVVLASAPDRWFTLAELTASVSAEPVMIEGRPGKVVSDSLRAAVSRGWVVRGGRGRYRLGRVPPTTLRRARRWRQALRQGMTPHQRSSYANWRAPRDGPGWPPATWQAA